MKFRYWLETKENPHRIDTSQITDFNPGLKNYWFDPKGTGSGGTEMPGWNKRTGLFAGKLKDVIPYATPRNTRWMVLNAESKRPTVIFDVKDKPTIVNHRPFLSKFPSQDFEFLPSSGEYFSEKPPSAIRQEKIRNPLAFINQWYNIQFVPDIESAAQELLRKGIHFNAEGLYDILSRHTN